MAWVRALELALPSFIARLWHDKKLWCDIRRQRELLALGTDRAGLSETSLSSASEQGRTEPGPDMSRMDASGGGRNLRAVLVKSRGTGSSRIFEEWRHT